MKGNFIMSDQVFDYRRKARQALQVLFVFMLLSLTPVVANTFSQQINTIFINSKTVKQAFNEIEKNSEYKFLYSANVEKELGRKINLNITSDNLEEILDSQPLVTIYHSLYQHNSC